MAILSTLPLLLSLQLAQTGETTMDPADAPRVCRRLRCTPEQARELDGIRRRTEAAITDERQQLADLNRALANEIRSAGFDTDRANSIQGRIRSVEAEIDEQYVSALAGVHATLQPQQREVVARIVSRVGLDGFMRKLRPRRGASKDDDKDDKDDDKDKSKGDKDKRGPGDKRKGRGRGRR